MSHILFKPWIGAAYRRAEMFGKRVMILGESHYEGKQDGPPAAEWTRTYIRRQMTGERSRAFWTRIVHAFIGHTTETAEKRDFWRSVAFYNYIQQSVGDGPRIRPTREMWEDSEPAFAEVLYRLKPQVLIVLGYQLWRKLPELDRVPGRPIACMEQPETWLYPLKNGGACLAYGIKHPSAGFTSSDWRPHIHKVIQRAPT